ncbi:hypothetical protein [Lewinella sp. 4G2]|uniref:hypothetical protein n=1 Tax=Lewinella sp. 4G2 TaxID=1803372 RepID=UPI0012F9CD96|nr:hypothetical protein [Lewinella sp. 4G2]
MKTASPVMMALLALLLCTCDSAQTGVAEEPAESPEVVSEAQRRVNEASNIALVDSPNPAAPGFNVAGSDAKAIRVVDSLVKYHGGRAAYDAARYFRWNFFGARTLSWDKLEKLARINVPEQNTVYLLNYGTTPLSGRIRVKGDEVTDPDALAEGLKKAHSMLINDSYWLVHQFKLKDDGVTLKAAEDVRTDPLATRPSFVIDQTFDGVGETPGNRYRLYIDKVTYRINTWQFFRNADDEEPAMQTPWNGYVPHNGLLLSGDRGGRFQLTDIGVPKLIREREFKEF